MCILLMCCVFISYKVTAATSSNTRASFTSIGGRKRGTKPSLKTFENKWLRFTRSMLEFEQHQRLRVILDETTFPESEFNTLMWHAFLSRVSRQYRYVWRQQKKDETHAKRESLVKGAVIEVLGQIRPKKVQPLDGDTTKLVELVQPWLELVFAMPGPTKKDETGAGWIQQRVDDIKAGVYDYKAIGTYDVLMDTFLSKMMSKYPDGYPPLDPGNLPGPDDQYELSADRIGMRRSTKPSQPFNIMRHGAVCNVVIKMKNNNKTVVKVSAKNSPEMDERRFYHVGIPISLLR